jgi:hypothetical protein
MERFLQRGAQAAGPKQDALVTMAIDMGFEPEEVQQAYDAFVEVVHGGSKSKLGLQHACDFIEFMTARGQEELRGARRRRLAARMQRRCCARARMCSPPSRAPLAPPCLLRRRSRG